MRYPPQPKLQCETCGSTTISTVVKSEAVQLRRPVTLETPRGRLEVRDVVRRMRLCQTCLGSLITIEVPYRENRVPRHRPRARALRPQAQSPRMKPGEMQALQSRTKKKAR